MALPEFKIRDERKAGHHWADNEVIDDFGPIIGATGYAIYMYLGRHAGNRNAMCCKSQNEIAKAFDLSRDTVNRYIGILSDAALIQIKSTPGEPLVYLIAEVPKHPVGNSDTPLPPVRKTDTPVGNSDTPLSEKLTPLSEIQTRNKEVKTSSKLNTKLLSKQGNGTGDLDVLRTKEPDYIGNDLGPSEAGHALADLLGVSGFTKMAAIDSIGTVKRRKPEMKYIDIPQFVRNLWIEVQEQPTRAKVSLKTFLSEIGTYIDSDKWRVKPKEPEAVKPTNGFKPASPTPEWAFEKPK